MPDIAESGRVLATSILPLFRIESSMHLLLHVVLPAALAGFLLAAPACGESPPFAESETAAVSWDESEAESELVRLANQERRRRGLPEFGVDDRLTAAARRHAQVMAERRELSHKFVGEPKLMDRVAATGLRFDRVAENVAFNDSASGAHEGLMNSKGHRENLLNHEYNAIGVGVARRGDMLYVAQNFVRRLPERSADQAEEILAARVNELRRERRLPKVARQRWPELRQAACNMAHRDKLEADVGRPSSERRRVIAFTIARLEDPPDALVKAAANPSLDRFAVGACFERTSKYPSGIFWVLMAFYF